MALDGLTRRVQTLDLSDLDCLVFNPTGDRTWLRETFDDVPRYLFRVSTPRSSGDTDRFWVKSKDSVIDPTTSSVDIFSGDDDYRTASMLYRHLCWREGADNFVSWTSSLLVALQYIFYRHTSPKDGSRLDDINFCIVDTTRFPRGVFLRDMDLIKVYYSYSTELESFRGLRQRQHPSHSGFFYFGEYLLQGALKVEGKCQIISAQAMIDAGLFTLQPFRTMENRLPNGSRWANEVVRLREPFYSTTEDAQQTPHEELLAAKAISDRFEPRWRLPMACHLIALVPRKDEDGVVALVFQAIRLAGEMRARLYTERPKLVPATLPEVQEADKILRGILQHVRIHKLINSIEEFHTMLTLNMDQDQEIQDSMEWGYEALIEQLDSVVSVQISMPETVTSQYEGN